MNLEEKLYRENLELASIGARLLAFLVDKILISFVFMLIYWEAFSQTGGDYAAIANFVAKVVWQFIFLSAAYEALFLVFYGATLGKLLFKIRVVDIVLLDSPNFLYATIRSVIKVLSENLFYAPYALIFFSSSRQVFHDYVAKTVVIKNNV